jgi:hypothetical protein
MIAVLEQKRRMKVKGIHADYFSGNIHARCTQVRILEGSITVRKTRELVLKDKQVRTRRITGTSSIQAKTTSRNIIQNLDSQDPERCLQVENAKTRGTSAPIAWNSITSCMSRKRSYQHWNAEQHNESSQDRYSQLEPCRID